MRYRDITAIFMGRVSRLAVIAILLFGGQSVFANSFNGLFEIEYCETVTKVAGDKMVASPKRVSLLISKDGTFSIEDVFSSTPHRSVDFEVSGKLNEWTLIEGNLRVIVQVSNATVTATFRNSSYTRTITWDTAGGSCSGHIEHRLHEGVPYFVFGPVARPQKFTAVETDVLRCTDGGVPVS